MTPIDWKKIVACFSEMHEIAENTNLSNSIRYRKLERLLTQHEPLLYELRRHPSSVQQQDELNLLLENIPEPNRPKTWIMGIVGISYIALMAFTLGLNIWVLIALPLFFFVYFSFQWARKHRDIQQKLPLVTEAVRRLYYFSENNALDTKSSIY